MRTSPLVCVLLALAAPAFADPIPLWPAAAPGEKGDVPAEMEQPLRPGDDTIRVANVSKPTMTIYHAPADKDTGTTVLICPGGGYNILAWNKEGTEVAQWLNGIGVTGVVLKYRVPGRKGQDKYLAPLQDAQRAMGLLRSKAAEYRIDPKKIGVLGFSAGGHLAASLSTNHAARKYDAVDDADKASCRPDFSVLVYPAYLVGADDKLAPELTVSADTPRTFITITQDDPVRVEGPLTYFLALKKAKVPSELHVYPVGGHGYGLRPSDKEVSSWPKRAEPWFASLGLLERKK